jgi:pimeloyl-ACP methyl ester carboxylesterase
MLNAFSESPTLAAPVLGTHGWELLASSLGPSAVELNSALETPSRPVNPLDTEVDDDRYPISVKSRVASGGWGEKIRLYRENLLAAKWNKSLQLVWELNQIETAHTTTSISSASSTSASSLRRRSSAFKAGANGLFDFGPRGSLGAATTVLWGVQDVALNQQLAMDGIGEYFGVNGSHFVTLQNVGHWTPMSRAAVGVWETVIAWALGGEEGALGEALVDYPNAKIVVGN